MFRHGNFPGVVQMARGMIRTEIGVVIAVAAFSVLVGWHSGGEVAQAFLIAGMLILGVGVLGSATGRNDPHCLEHQYVRTTMLSLSSQDRAQQDRPGVRLSFAQFFQSALLSGLTLGIGLVIGLLFG